MKLKRLRDITNKRMVFVKGPTGQECQVWIDETTNKMYYYDRAQWVEYEQSSENDGKTYGSTWQTIDGDDDMGVYDTNNPTDLFTWESGDKVSYVFKDWNGTVLKEGKVNEGTAPTAPADPTREATAQYTYTFAGWNPTVGPISKKTTFTATYTATVNQYTVTISSNDTSWGTVDESSLTLDYGTAISVNDNTVTFGTGESAVVVTATAISPATFTNWTAGGEQLPATVTSDLAVLATFYSTIETLYSGENGTIIHDIAAGEITYTYTGETTSSVTTGDTLIIADKDIGATSYDVASTDSVGYCYQWGNNYGFPHTGALQTSDVQVDASSYTASTYSSSTFVTGKTWDSSNNKDLWGGETGTDLAKKGPCPDGYHIPSKDEFEKLENMISAITGTIDSTTSALVPYGIAWLDRNTGEIGILGGGYWTCTSGIKYPDDSACVALYDLGGVSEQYKCVGFSIRPFKNKEPKYTLTFIPRDVTNNTQGGGTLSSYSYTATQDGLYLWFNSSYSENLKIVTDPTQPDTTTIDTIVPTPDTGYSALDGWYYYNEILGSWSHINTAGKPITGNMQLRYHFTTDNAN